MRLEHLIVLLLMAFVSNCASQEVPIIISCPLMNNRTSCLQSDCACAFCTKKYNGNHCIDRSVTRIDLKKYNCTISNLSCHYYTYSNSDKYVFFACVSVVMTIFMSVIIITFIMRYRQRHYDQIE